MVAFILEKLTLIVLLFFIDYGKIFIEVKVMEVNYSEYFPIEEYYEKVVIPINPRRYKIITGKMICPMHDDHDPSLGIIKKKSGTEICHCFGCNYWGSILEFHQAISKKFFKKYLEPEGALKDLCRIFNVDYNSLPVGDLSSIEDKGIRQENELLKAMDEFDIGDFKHLIAEGKRQKKGIGCFNALLMVMISEIKESE